jgi:hypothetical protein
MNCLHLYYIVVTYLQTFMWLYFTSERFWDSCCYELLNYFFYQVVLPVNFVAQLQKSDDGTVKFM